MSIAPTTRDYSYKSLIVKIDKEHFDPDICYEFSNGKKFESTDRNGYAIKGNVTMDGDTVTMHGEEVTMGGS